MINVMKKKTIENQYVNLYSLANTSNSMLAVCVAGAHPLSIYLDSFTAIPYCRHNNRWAFFFFENFDFPSG
jgi:hypothetical protein